MQERNILEVSDLHVRFTQKKRLIKALDGVDLFLKKGMTTALAGESGCGKTTLAKTILGFHKPYSGKIYLEGKDITLRKHNHFIRKNIQIVFQNPFLSLDPRYTVFQSLREVLSVFNPAPKASAEEIIAEKLAAVELTSEIMNRYPHQLSGGQNQRVAIARSLINEPELIILDEPTSSLDVTTASKIMDLIRRLQERYGASFLFISHNLKILRKISHYFFIMYRGKIVEYGPKELVYNNPQHPYTQLLKEASNLKVKNIARDQPSSQGCPFFSRCPSKKDDCRYEPVKYEVEPEHFIYCHFPQ
jgi:oligopeptide/dipeptide ABC transporter ATP-binding protein